MNLNENFNDVISLIKSHLTDAHVEVNDLTGTRDHLDIMIVSDQFKGKMLIAQHRMIMDILKVPLQNEIHAVKLKTLTFDQYKK